MTEPDAKRFIEGRESEKKLPHEIGLEILRAIARIDYGSVEVVVHDGNVVQIECREKIRVACGEAGRKNTLRQIRQAE